MFWTIVARMVLSYALLLCPFIFATMPPKRTLAHLAPGAKYCGSFDSQQTIDSEKLDLSRQLPERYRKFQIVLFHERLLRVVVPADSVGLSEGSPQYMHILDIWGDVLAAHHPGCVVGVWTVQFYAQNGKMLFGLGTSV